MKSQFLVLYRQFLFRFVDLEVLSAHALGDVHKLLGQIAALLVFLSIGLALPALFLDAGRTPAARLFLAWSAEHFLIATTMLVVGIFAVLSWDATFPDRRDVMVLIPLPVRARTFFLAKVAAVATALAVVVGALHALGGLAWPVALNATAPEQMVAAFTSEPALPPAGAEDLETVLERSHLTGSPTLGIAIGVSKHGVTRLFSRGTASPDSIFQIGSVSKTFTALLLAHMIKRGDVRLDDPVRSLLPPELVNRPRGNEITLLDLATHRSGIPNMTRNAGDASFDVFELMARRGVAREAHPPFEYSNLGFGLLGQALARRAGMTYAELLRQEITGPLGMADTVISPALEQRRRVIQAYDPRGRPVEPRELNALAPAGAILSTAGDMLTYLEAHLRPQDALADVQKLHAQVAPGMHIALAWIYNTETGTYWHNGAISGYTSYAFFNPRRAEAAVVLVNKALDATDLADLLGEHIRARLAGQPAVSLATIVAPPHGGLARLLRLFAVYWIVMIASGAFVYCTLLAVQGLAAQLLSRRLFLRLSSFLHLAAFCLLLCVYFLEPLAISPMSLTAAQAHGWLAWSPSYWFLGLMQELNGSPAMAVLARRAWIALGAAIAASAVAYGLSYLRTLRRIVEEPDIAPQPRGGAWLPALGTPLSTALVQFSVRTLWRSRAHRVILAFYLGIGFAITILLLRSPAAQRLTEEAAVSDPWHEANAPLLAASIVMLGFWVVGTRAVFSLPLDLRANWILRISPVSGGTECLAARRRALWVLALAPAWIAAAVMFLCAWPWQAAAAHLLVLGLFGAVVAEVCLYGAQKIPFTCSYLPGKSNLHITFWLSIGYVTAVITKAADFERLALGNRRALAILVGSLAIALAGVRWWTAKQALEQDLRFEDAADPAVMELGLHRDGILTTGPDSGAAQVFPELN